MLLLNGKKKKQCWAGQLCKSRCQKYHIYTKLENKYYLFTRVMLNINIRQPNLT